MMSGVAARKSQPAEEKREAPQAPKAAAAPAAPASGDFTDIPVSNIRKVYFSFLLSLSPSVLSSFLF